MLQNFSYNSMDVPDDEIGKKILAWLNRNGYKLTEEQFDDMSYSDIVNMIDNYETKAKKRAFYNVVKRHYGNGDYNGFAWGYWGRWS